MKKFLFILLFIIFFNIFALDIKAANRTDYENIEGTILRASPLTDSTYIEKEIEIYNRLPDNIKEVLVENNIYYVLIDENIDNTDSNHTGTTYFKDYTLADVWAEGRLRKDIKYNGCVMIHEVGHVIDTFLYDKNVGLKSSSEEWVNIYNKNKSKIASFGYLSKWEVGNSEEAFSESFAHYINEPEKVLKKAPEVYYYFDNLVKNIKIKEEL